MAKLFDISDVLSITHARLVSKRGMAGVYDILNFMTGQSLMTHQLPRACEACRPALLKQFPKLAEDSADGIDTTNWKPWRQQMRAQHGDAFNVEPLQPGEYETMHPLAEPILKGKDAIVVKT